VRHVYRLLMFITLVGGSAAAWLLPVVGDASPVVDSTPTPANLRHQAIAFYERRLTEDPHSALDMTQLAALFMEDGRMRGDERAFVSAESLARRSLGERTRRNGKSAALLVNTLLAQHRFVEAKRVAEELVSAEPEQPAYRALLAETMMEVGDYRGAVSMLGTLRANRADLGIAPRFARWAELTGRPGEARRILRSTIDEARRRPDLTGEQRAWFSLRLADVELRHGHLRAAAKAIDDGLRESPGDWRLILARARLQAAKGQWKDAVRSSEEVIAAVPSPEAFALLAESNERLGRKEEAAGFTKALEGIARAKPGQMHRVWAMALLDHVNRSTEIAVLAAADTLVRRDVYTLDLLAWALHRAGRTMEALPLSRRAMALGSVEPALRFRAGIIEFAAGDSTSGRRHLELALRGKGALSSSQVAEARKTLKSAGR